MGCSATHPRTEQGRCERRSRQAEEWPVAAGVAGERTQKSRGFRPNPRFTVTPPGHTLLMERQLVLLEPDHPFRLDEQTKEIGRRNVARAREALRRARSEANHIQQGRPAA